MQAGSKRTREFSVEEADFPPLKHAKEADKQYEVLVGKLKKDVLKDDGMLLALIGGLTGYQCYRMSLLSPSIAQSAFSLLVQHEEFEVLEEVFLLYQEARKKEPYKKEGAAPEQLHRLAIKVPSAWTLSDPEGMARAFSKTAIKTLVIAVCSKEAYPVILPAGVSRCIVCLLRNGLTELIVQAGLADPDSVADAFSGSQLTSVAVNFNPDAKRFFAGNLRTEEWSSHLTLCRGLLSCQSLKNLTVYHRIQDAKAFLAKFDHIGAPQIESLTLALEHFGVFDEDQKYVVVLPGPGRNAAACQREIAEMMRMVALWPQLSSLSVSERMSADGSGRLKDVFFKPLAGNTRLETLNITGGQCAGESANLLRSLARFSAACPALTHFSWQHDEEFDKTFGDPTEVIDELMGAPDEIDTGAAHDDADTWLLSPACKLRSVKLKGAVLEGRDLRRFLQVVLQNTSLWHFDIAGCKVDLKPVLDFLPQLGKNRYLEGLELPTNVTCYYWLRSDGRVTIFHRGDSVGFGRFTLPPPKQGDSEHERVVQGEAVLALEERRECADGLLEIVRDQLADNRRAFVVAHLAPSVQNLLAASAGSGGNRGTFDGIAHRITSYLVDSDATATAVHLSEVVKTPSDVIGIKTDPALATLKLRAQVASDLVNKSKFETRAAAEKLEAAAREKAEKTTAFDRVMQPDVPGYGVLGRLSPGDAELFDQALVAIDEDDVESLLDLIDDGLMLNVVQQEAGKYTNVLIENSEDKPDMLRILQQAGAIDLGGWVDSTRRASSTANEPAPSLGATVRKTQTDVVAASSDSFVTEPRPMSEREKDHLFAAMGAIGANDVPTLKVALAAGLSVNTVDGNGANMLLMAAITWNKAEMVTLLIGLEAEDYYGFGAKAALRQSQEVRDALNRIHRN
ncbi:hypothetical protein [Hydrogenophaga sp.]|uniref:hypothetical protein n=1 Tax=Hydrogenophaga sp. TaxID=1904254 RepID=UPI002727B15A|nr:hypothetical protein [Hydrogenophaga sp.]MDO9437472.1 hypothetical protein [Hydrogenophaga sp.]